MTKLVVQEKTNAEQAPTTHSNATDPHTLYAGWSGGSQIRSEYAVEAFRAAVELAEKHRDFHQSEVNPWNKTISSGEVNFARNVAVSEKEKLGVRLLQAAFAQYGRDGELTESEQQTFIQQRLKAAPGTTRGGTDRPSPFPGVKPTEV